MFLCSRGVALMAILSLAMVGLAPSSRAEPPEAGAMRAVRDLEHAAAYVQQVQLEEAIASLEEQVGSFVNEVKRSEAIARSRPSSAVTRSPEVHPAGGTGECGGATNGADRFIQRESGGNPYVVNSSSGAFGCYQIMPYVWDANCRDLGHDPQGQAACASRLPLSAWGG